MCLHAKAVNHRHHRAAAFPRAERRAPMTTTIAPATDRAPGDPESFRCDIRRLAQMASERERLELESAENRIYVAMWQLRKANPDSTAHYQRMLNHTVYMAQHTIVAMSKPDASRNLRIRKGQYFTVGAGYEVYHLEQFGYASAQRDGDCLQVVNWGTPYGQELMILGSRGRYSGVFPARYANLQVSR